MQYQRNHKSIKNDLIFKKKTLINDEFDKTSNTIDYKRSLSLSIDLTIRIELNISMIVLIRSKKYRKWLKIKIKILRSTKTSNNI